MPSDFEVFAREGVPNNVIEQLQGWLHENQTFTSQLNFQAGLAFVIRTDPDVATWVPSDITNAANLSKIQFNDVTLDLGNFIDGIANKISQVFMPLQPVIKTLTAPLPVLSQLAGHNYSLVDLATQLRYVESWHSTVC